MPTRSVVETLAAASAEVVERQREQRYVRDCSKSPETSNVLDVTLF